VQFQIFLENMTDYSHKLNLYDEEVYKFEEYNKFRIQYLYSTFIRDSLLFKMYGQKIKVNWKANILPIKNIYLPSHDDIINHVSLFSRYDLYFKFYIAAFYYEIKICLKYTDSSLSCFESTKNNFNDLWVYKFPQELNFFLSDIQTFLNYHLNEKQDSNNQICIIKNQLQTKIENQFKQFNVVFDDQPSSGSTKTSRNKLSFNVISSTEKKN